MSYGRIDSINLPSGSALWLGVYGSHLLASNGSTVYKYKLSDNSLDGSFAATVAAQSYIDGDDLWAVDGVRIRKYDLTTELLDETYRVVLDTGTYPYATAVFVTEAVAQAPPYNGGDWLHLTIDTYAKTSYGHFVKDNGTAADITFNNALALGTIQSGADSEYPSGTAIENDSKIYFGYGTDFRTYSPTTGAFISNVAQGGVYEANGLFKSDKLYGSTGHIAQNGNTIYATSHASIHTLANAWEEDIAFGSPSADIGIFGSPPETPTGLTATCSKETVPVSPGFNFNIIQGGF